jgi:hypothetical protein
VRCHGHHFTWRPGVEDGKQAVDVGASHHLAGRQDHQPLDPVPQLTHVAGPWPMLQARHRVLPELAQLHAH